MSTYSRMEIGGGLCGIQGGPFDARGDGNVSSLLMWYTRSTQYHCDLLLPFKASVGPSTPFSHSPSLRSLFLLASPPSLWELLYGSARQRFNGGQALTVWMVAPGFEIELHILLLLKEIWNWWKENAAFIRLCTCRGRVHRPGRL